MYDAYIPSLEIVFPIISKGRRRNNRRARCGNGIRGGDAEELGG
jgi:hypothetical protein